MVAPGDEGITLAAAVRRALEDLPWSRARALCTTGRVRVDGAVARDPALRLEAGSVVEIAPDAPRERAGTLAREAIVHVDADVVVVRKPAGVMTVPFEGERDTLVDRTRAALRRLARRGGPPPELGVVHRLDKDTTGLLVFTRTLAAKRQLEQQFRKHSTLRRYLAIAHGRVEAATYESDLVQDRGDGLRGSWGRSLTGRGGRAPAAAQHAITHVRPVEPLRGATLVSVQLETGRQHQIRIHLSEAGHPLVGEKVYIRRYPGQLIAAPRPMLHAEMLGFVHPRTEEPLQFEEPPPEDFRLMLEKLRK